MPPKKAKPSRPSKSHILPIPPTQNYPISTQPYPYQPSLSPLTLFLIIFIVLLSFFAGYFYFQLQAISKGIPQAGGTQEQGQERPPELKIKKPETSEHWRGDKGARYVWVEYSDLECPFCKDIHPNLVKILDENKDQMAWVFRHFPLNSIHPKAQKAAEAAECAADQGGTDAFWSMVDIMYERMPAVELAQLSSIGGELGLDQGALQTCLDSDKFADKVKKETDEAIKAGVGSTPTNVIYDLKTGKSHPILGAAPYDQLKSELDGFIAENK